MNRRQLREYTFKALFHVSFYEKAEVIEQVHIYLESCMSPEEGQLLLLDAERQQIEERFQAVFEKLPEIDQWISENTEGWELSRMNRVDLSIIRLAVYEMLEDAQVPIKVAINEAVDLAKTYGGEESGQFVNGVLAKCIKKESVPKA